MPGTSMVRLALFGGFAQVVETCAHAVSRPRVSISNSSRVVLPSGITVLSPTCRRGEANRFFTAADAITAFQIS